MTKNLFAALLALALTSSAFASGPQVGTTNTGSGTAFMTNSVSNTIAGSSTSFGTGTSFSQASNSQSALSTFKSTSATNPAAGTSTIGFVGTTQTTGQALAFNSSTGLGTGSALSVGGAKSSLQAQANESTFTGTLGSNRPCAPVVLPNYTTASLQESGFSTAQGSNTVFAGTNQAAANLSQTKSGIEVSGTITNLRAPDGTITAGVSDSKFGFSNTATNQWSGSTALNAAGISVPTGLGNASTQFTTGSGTFGSTVHGTTSTVVNFPAFGRP